MPSFFVDDIDIDVDEFWNSCSKRDKEELLEILRYEGIIPKTSGNLNPNLKSYLSPYETDFRKKLDQLNDCYYQLSNDDIQVIENLVHKYI